MIITSTPVPIKRVFIFLLFFFSLISKVNAQSKLDAFTQNVEVPYFSVGGGVGSSNILINGTSFGFLVDSHFLFIPNLAAGIKTGINFSSDKITALETQTYARWYFWPIEIRQESYWNQINIFLQGGLGILAAFKGGEARDSRSSILFDATVGVSIPLASNWHIEPSLRAGYPFMVGFAVTAGYKFPLQKTKYREVPPIEIIKTIKIASVEYIIFAANISKYNEGLDASTKSLNEVIINQVTQTLKENPGFLIRLAGHANPITNDPKEATELYRLSMERANEISRILKAKGVKEEQIVVIAHGGTRIVTSSRDEWSRNRRVELIVIQVE
ncbi:hypothetical protein R84B8_01581 [Treponema sp. R8-4-B8]